MVNVVEGWLGCPSWLYGLQLFHANVDICVESVAYIYQAVGILFVVTGAKLPQFTSYRMVDLSRPRLPSCLQFLKLFRIKFYICA